MKVGIIFGSQSDVGVMKKAAECLKDYGVSYESYVLSAHRVPELLASTLKELEDKGCQVIIAGAGLAAHLPGVIASKTLLPVIGVPIKSALEGVDALLSIVQMPKGIPVATVGINNAYNAGMLAVQILATQDDVLRQRLHHARVDMKSTLETQMYIDL